jgi:AbrB family looped-hinge helix DNA binding protein
MTHRVGAKGQVVIPKAIRDELGIEPGDEVVFEADGRDVRVRRREDEVEARRARIDSLRGALKDVPGFSTADLEADRSEERRREDEKWGLS